MAVMILQNQLLQEQLRTATQGSIPPLPPTGLEDVAMEEDDSPVSICGGRIHLEGSPSISLTTYCRKQMRRHNEMLDGIWPGDDDQTLLSHFMSHHFDKCYDSYFAFLRWRETRISKVLGTVVRVQNWHMPQEMERRIALQTREALQQTLQDHPDDLENAPRDGPSCQSDFTHSTGNSTLNSNRTAQGPARREEALKSLSLINKNCKLTEELAKERDWFATKAEAYWLLEDCLQQFELRDAQPPALLTNNTKMVVEGTRGAGKVPCSGDSNKDEMVVVLQGGG